jgi:ABC-type nitrate/sulfonate/bicarbonate transport system substrate-binding protein
MPRLLPALVFAFLATAIGAEVARAQNQPIDIRIGWQPDANGVFFVARKYNLFEKAGLRPQYIKFLSGPAMFAAMRSKSIDITEMAISPFVNGVANGIPMVAISVAFNEGKVNALVARPDSGISSVANLRGKKVAATKGSLSYFGLAREISRNNMSFSDIKYLNMAVPTIIPAMRHGDIDAAWAWEPWAQRMVESGGKIIATVDDIVGDVWVADKEWLAANLEAAVRFVAAMDMAAKKIREEPEVTIPDIAEALSIPKEMARDIMSKVVSPTAAEQLDPNSPNTVIDFALGKKGLGASIKSVSEFFMEQSMIKDFPPLDKVFDSRPLMTYGKRNNLL